MGFYSCDNSGQVVYRLYKRSTGVRFYTASINEKNNLKSLTINEIYFLLMKRISNKSLIN